MMHGNNFNSLNFQHGGYQDPFADLQQSLGAGGIFSQTLKQMNQDMYANAQRDRTDEEFKWRKDDRARQEQERNNATALRSALFEAKTTGKDGIGNDLFSGEVAKTNGGQDMFIDPSNAKYGNLSVNQDAINAIKAQAADSKYKDNADLQNFLKVANSDKGFDSQFNGDYSSSSKAAMLHGAYKALGMSDEDAMKNASLALGNSNIVSDTLKANSKLNTFANDLQSQVIHNPSLRKTDLDVVSDLIASMPKEKVTDNLYASWENLDAAQTAAIKAKKDEINRLKIEQGRNADSEQQKQLELQLKAMEEKQAIAALKVKGDTASLNASGLGATATQYDPNKDYYSLAAKAANSAISGYGTAALKGENAAAVQQARDYADRLIASGIRPEMLQSRINAFLKYDGDVKDGKLTAAKSTADMLRIKDSDKVDPSEYQQRSKLSQSDQVLAKQIYDAELNGHMDKLAALQKIAASGHNAANEISSQLANLERSSQQAASAEAYNAGKQLAVDHGWGDPDPVVKQKPVVLDIGDNGSGAGVKGQNLTTGNRLFDGAKNIMGMGEGTAFNVYNDTMIVNGVKKDRPATAYGTSIDDINATIKDKSLWISPNQKMLTPVQQEYAKKVIDARIQQDLADASKYTKKYRIESEALNIGLANMIHQYGPGSKIVSALANDIASSVAKNDYQGAVNKVLRSSYASAYPDRAAAMVQLLAHEAPNSSAINTGNTMKYGSAKAAADYYNNSYKALKAKGYSDDDIATTMSMLQRGFANQNILGINYGSANNPLGMSGVSQGLQRSIVANEAPLPTTGLSPNDIMLDRLRFQNGNVKMSANDFKDPDYAKGLREDVLNTQANNAAADFKYYSNQNAEQQKLYNQHLEDDGKLPSQIDLVWRAGLQKQYQEANSPKERLKAIADAQRKLANGNVALSNDPLKNLVNNRY